MTTRGCAPHWPCGSERMMATSARWSPGSSGAREKSGVRATASVGDVCCEKIHGCSYREMTRLTPPCSQCNISVVPSTERNFGARTPIRSVQVCKRSGRGHSVSNQFREARRGSQSANALRDIFGNQPPRGNGEFDEVAVHSHCYLFFGNRTCSECAAQSR
jgi:hypothetical protein